jgi:hypothetical protein
MKTLIIFLLILILSVPCFAIDVPVDKAAHFGIGGLITAVLTDKLEMDKTMAVITVLSLAIVKEYAIDDTPDWGDVEASLLGSLFYVIW